MVKLTPQAPALVNFDFTDIANGTGYEYYYPIQARDSVGITYNLTAQSDYSDEVKIATNLSNSPNDIDYDLTPFVIPRTVNGKVLLSIPVDVQATITPTLVAELYRWDGTTETKIGSTMTYDTQLTTAGKMIYMTMDVDNELIPVGQTLRLRIQVTNVNGNFHYYGIDPANRTDAILELTTQTKLSIPYKLDS